MNFDPEDILRPDRAASWRQAGAEARAEATSAALARFATTASEALEVIALAASRNRARQAPDSDNGRG